MPGEVVGMVGDTYMLEHDTHCTLFNARQPRGTLMHALHRIGKIANVGYSWQDTVCRAKETLHPVCVVKDSRKEWVFTSLSTA